VYRITRRVVVEGADHGREGNPLEEERAEERGFLSWWNAVMGAAIESAGVGREFIATVMAWCCTGDMVDFARVVWS